MWLFAKFVSPWVKKKNAASLKSTGMMSAEIQESLGNFKVVLAFNRRDYFRQRFASANTNNYSASIGAGVANNVYTPVFGFFASMGQPSGPIFSSPSPAGIVSRGSSRSSQTW
jgi:ATP-binding cassette subfamily B protein